MFSGKKSLKNKRAKKSVNALIIASSAAASVAVPGIFNAVATLRASVKTSANKNAGGRMMGTAETTTASAAVLGLGRMEATPTITAAMKATGTGLGAHRTHSMYVGPAGIQLQNSLAVQTISNNNRNVMVKESISSGSVIGEDEDWDAEFDLGPTGLSKTEISGTVGSCVDGNNSASQTRNVAVHGTTTAPVQQLLLQRVQRGGVDGGVRRTPAARILTNKNNNSRPHAPTTVFAKRRVQSAPSVAQHTQSNGRGGITDVLLEDFEENEDQDNENEEDNEFVVASVKQKVVTRRERELERSFSADGGLESWDDDFEGCCDNEAGGSNSGGGGGVYGNGEGGRSDGLFVPDAVLEIQQSLKVDAENFKRFALHIEDLKLMFMDAKLMARGLGSDKPMQLATINKQYATHLEMVQVLMDLGEYSETAPDKFVSDERNLRVLSEIISDNSSNKDIQSLSSSTSASSADTLCSLRDIAAKNGGKLHMGVGVMPLLIQSICKAKGMLGEYVIELRRVAISKG